MTPNNIKKRFNDFFINLATSGKYSEENEFGITDYFIRYIVMNFILFFGAIVLTAFTVVNLQNENYPDSIVCGIMVVVCIVAFILARTKARQIIPASIGVISYGLLCIMLIWLGEANGAGFVFIYIYPLISIMLLGIQLGITLSVILFVIVAVEVLTPGLINFEYHIDLSSRMLASYILVLSLIVVIETSRKRKDRLIKTQNRNLQELKEKAEAASRSKGEFLAKMSHEIRTPMNAITGMAELASRENMSNTAREHVLTIKQAGANLLSIINDILDFSKIEAGKLEIVPVDYLFSSLVNDVINIIRMKIIDSQIDFVVNIDCNIPNALFGDETRVRQVLLNILNNAAKFTSEGFVALTVTGEINENTVILTIKVADSGRGIKQEDINKLFGDFVQIDLNHNIGIEGSGLGLAIAKSIVTTMNGDISVESEYGIGSTFTVTLPQKIREHVKLASVENPDEKAVLIYELRDIYAQSLVYAVNNLGVNCKLVSTDTEFYNEAANGSYSFVFVAYELYEKVRNICSDLKSPVKIIRLAQFGEATADQHLSTITMPIYSLSVANTLNGTTTSSTFSINSVSFTFPSARLLVVDDIEINLEIAKGLLEPYQTTVDTCLSGAQAIELVTKNEYDLIFLDHMMPEMDGIETITEIRAWENKQQKNNAMTQQIPIIALTANVVSGMKEVFIENSFNDLLPKPIDILKLDEMLSLWIPKNKRITRITT